MTPRLLACLHGIRNRAQLSKPPRFVTRPNDFPYNLTPDIQHLIIWCNRGSFSPEEVEAHVKEQQGDVYEALHFINSPHLRSIPDISHAHVFLRRRASVPVLMEACVESVQSALAAKAGGTRKRDIIAR